VGSQGGQCAPCSWGSSGPVGGRPAEPERAAGAVFLIVGHYYEHLGLMLALDELGLLDEDLLSADGAQGEGEGEDEGERQAAQAEAEAEGGQSGGLEEGAPKELEAANNLSTMHRQPSVPRPRNHSAQLQSGRLLSTHSPWTTISGRGRARPRRPASIVLGVDTEPQDEGDHSARFLRGLLMDGVHWDKGNKQPNRRHPLDGERPAAGAGDQVGSIASKYGRYVAIVPSRPAKFHELLEEMRHFYANQNTFGPPDAPQTLSGASPNSTLASASTLASTSGASIEQALQTGGTASLQLTVRLLQLARLPVEAYYLHDAVQLMARYFAHCTRGPNATLERCRDGAQAFAWFRGRQYASSVDPSGWGQLDWRARDEGSYTLIGRWLANRQSSSSSGAREDDPSSSSSAASSASEDALGFDMAPIGEFHNPDWALDDQQLPGIKLRVEPGSVDEVWLPLWCALANESSPLARTACSQLRRRPWRAGGASGEPAGAHSEAGGWSVALAVARLVGLATSGWLALLLLSDWLALRLETFAANSAADKLREEEGCKLRQMDSPGRSAAHSKRPRAAGLSLWSALCARSSAANADQQPAGSSKSTASWFSPRDEANFLHIVQELLVARETHCLAATDCRLAESSPVVVAATGQPAARRAPHAAASEHHLHVTIGQDRSAKSPESCDLASFSLLAKTSTRHASGTAANGSRAKSYPSWASWAKFGPDEDVVDFGDNCCLRTTTAKESAITTTTEPKTSGQHGRLAHRQTVNLHCYMFAFPSCRFVHWLTALHQLKEMLFQYQLDAMQGLQNAAPSPMVHKRPQQRATGNLQGATFARAHANANGNGNGNGNGDQSGNGSEACLESKHEWQLGGAKSQLRAGLLRAFLSLVGGDSKSGQSTVGHQSHTNASGEHGTPLALPVDGAPTRRASLWRCVAGGRQISALDGRLRAGFFRGRHSGAAMVRLLLHKYKAPNQTLCDLHHLDHPNVQKLVAISLASQPKLLDGKGVQLVFAPSERGTLRDELRLLNGNLYLSARAWHTFKLHLWRSLTSDLLNGLEYLHHSQVKYHGNLWAKNCFLTADWRLKLAGFHGDHLRRSLGPYELRLASIGAAHQEQQSADLDNYYEEILYFAPELLQNHTRRSELDSRSLQLADIYSLSLVLFELFVGRDPWACALQDSQLEVNCEKSTPPTTKGGPDVNCLLNHSKKVLLIDRLKARPGLRPPMERLDNVLCSFIQHQHEATDQTSETQLDPERPHFASAPWCSSEGSHFHAGGGGAVLEEPYVKQRRQFHDELHPKELQPLEGENHLEGAASLRYHLKSVSSRQQITSQTSHNSAAFHLLDANSPLLATSSSISTCPGRCFLSLCFDDLRTVLRCCWSFSASDRPQSIGIVRSRLVRFLALKMSPMLDVSSNAHDNSDDHHLELLKLYSKLLEETAASRSEQVAREARRGERLSAAMLPQTVHPSHLQTPTTFHNISLCLAKFSFLHSRDGHSLDSAQARLDDVQFVLRNLDELVSSYQGHLQLVDSQADSLLRFMVYAGGPLSLDASGQASKLARHHELDECILLASFALQLLEAANRLRLPSGAGLQVSCVLQTGGRMHAGCIGPLRSTNPNYAGPLVLARYLLTGEPLEQVHSLEQYCAPQKILISGQFHRKLLQIMSNQEDLEQLNGSAPANRRSSFLHGINLLFLDDGEQIPLRNRLSYTMIKCNKSGPNDAYWLLNGYQLTPCQKLTLPHVLEAS